MDDPNYFYWPEDRASVYAAAREWDELGEDAFLRKYDQTSDKGCHVKVGFKWYPTKVMASAAWKVENPDDPRIPNFHTNTAEKIFADLGFECTRR